MNIGIVTDTFLPRVNGVVASIRAFTQQFRVRGHRVFIIAPRFPKYTDADPDVVRFPSHYLWFDPEDRLADTKLPSARRLIRRLADLKLDLLHTQTPFVLGIAAMGWAKKLKIPILHTYHTLFEAYVHLYLKGVPPSLGRRFAIRFSRWYCNRMDAVVVPSSAMAASLREYRVVKPVVIAPTGIDLSPFKSVDGPRMRAKLGFTDDDDVLLTMGRVAREKNVPFLFDVLARLLPQRPRARLVIAGQGPALEEIKQECARRKLAPSTTFVGYLDRKDWADLYAAADLHVLASVTETQGLVLTEAMAAGTPCVAISAMGVADVMAGGGGLAVGQNVDEFTNAVLKLLTDPALYAAKVEEAKRQAQAWSIEAKAGELLGHYERAIAEKKRTT